MTSYVDDNLFPKVLITEGSAPATPAAGGQVLYIPSSTHHLTRKDSSGTVVDLEMLASGVASATGTANQVVVSASTGAVTFSTPQNIATTSSVTFKSVAAGGLTGATAATRYVGGLATGAAPGSGTFLTGDYLIGQDASLWICTAGGTPGTWVKAGGGGGGAMVQISAQTLGSPAASIIFSSIAGTYNALLLHLQPRSSAAANFDSISLQVNGDTGANYDSEVISAFGTSVTAAQVFGGTSAFIGYSSANTSPAGDAPPLILELPGYAGTVFNKTWHVRASTKEANSSGSYGLTVGTGTWRSTSAITSLTVAYASANFIIGTKAILWGIT